MSRQKKRHRTVNASPADQEMIRRQAKAAGKTVSAHLLDLAQGDDPSIHPLVLTPGEQEEIRDQLHELVAVHRMLRQALPVAGGTNYFVAMAAAARLR
ncbi:MAG: hypothetical protein OXQ84_06110 [bacterium]|nr:hypothetical protein [bacterium]